MVPSLMSRRYAALLRQMLAEGMTQREVAAKLGVTQAAISFYVQGDRNAKPDKIEAAMRKLHLRAEFFNDPSIGDSPDYREFLGGGERTERDADRGYPVVERYLEQLEQAGTPALPAHARRLRGVRLSGGPDDMDEEMVRGLHRGMIAADARKALDAPLADEARVDVARGQRRLPSTKRRGS